MIVNEGVEHPREERREKRLPLIASDLAGTRAGDDAFDDDWRRRIHSAHASDRSTAFFHPAHSRSVSPRPLRRELAIECPVAPHVVEAVPEPTASPAR